MSRFQRPTGLKRLLVAVRHWVVEALRTPRGRWLAVALGGTLAAWLVAPVLPLAGFVAPALVLSALLVFWDPASVFVQKLLARHNWLEPVLLCCIVAAATHFTFGFLLTEGRVLDSKDHAVMLPRTKEMVEGNFQNWTHYLQGGEGLFDLYPFTPAVVMWLLKAITSLSFEQCYSLVVVSAWSVRGVAVYALARRFSGPLVSTLLTVAALYDVGDGVWDGTWAAALHWGVLHSNLALSFALLALASQVDLTRRITPRAVIATGLWAGLAVLTHALAVLYLTLSGLCLLLSVVVLPGRRRRYWWALGALFAGMLLPAPWLVPYLRSLSQLSFNFSEQGLLYLTVGDSFYKGLHPSGEFSGFVGFAMLAVVAALTMRERRLFAPALCTSLVVALMLASLLSQAGIYDLFPGLLRSQPIRMHTLLKVSSLPVLAWLLASVFRHLQKSRSLSGMGLARRTLVIVALTFTLAVPTLQYFDLAAFNLQRQVAGNRALPNLRIGSEVSPSLHASMNWIGARRAEDPSPTPWRMATYWPKIRRFGLWSQPWRIDVPLVDMSAIPGNFLGIRPRERSLQSFHEWNVRYIITATEQALLPGTTRVYGQREHVVWQVDDYDDRFVVVPPEVTVHDLRVEGDSIRFRIDGVPEQGVVARVRSAWFPRWRGWLDGAPAEVKRVDPFVGAKPKQDQLGVFIPKSGRVELRCDGLMPGFWSGLVLALMSALTLAGAASGSLRRGFEGRLSAVAARIRDEVRRRLRGRWRAVWIGLVALAVVGSGIVWLRGSRRLSLPGPFGTSATFTVETADGQRIECPKRRLGVGYLCTHPRSSVISWLGKDPPPDDSGEFPMLWDGIQLVLTQPDTVGELRFDRVDLDGGALVLKYNASGDISITGSIAGRAIPQQKLSAASVLRLPVPTDAGVAPVVLRFIGRTASSWVVFRGQVE